MPLDAASNEITRPKNIIAYTTTFMIGMSLGSRLRYGLFDQHTEPKQGIVQSL
jgi:hypothetical protein